MSGDGDRISDAAAVEGEESSTLFLVFYPRSNLALFDRKAVRTTFLRRSTSV
jgi:hypothetical protein